MNETKKYKTLPMKMHKNCVVTALRNHPEELAQIAPDWDGTAEEFIAAILAHPSEWIIDGVLGAD